MIYIETLSETLGRRPKVEMVVSALKSLDADLWVEVPNPQESQNIEWFQSVLLSSLLMMECQSFGSNYHLSSQSRKVSIGVLINSIADSKAKNIKEQEAEKLTPGKRNCMEDGIKGEGFTPIVEKHVVVPEQDISPWVSIRSFNQKTPTSMTVKDAEHTLSFPSTSKRRYRSKGSKEASEVHSVQFFVSKTTALESDEGKQNFFGKATYTRKAGKMDSAEHVDNLAFGIEPEILPDKGLAEGKTNKSETGGSETLRMKLWEILGNVSSTNKECPISLPVNTDIKDLHPDHESNRKGSPAGKPRQNSDTIESDSERPDRAVRRPLTRSLTRKKAPTKMQSNKTGNSKFTSYRKEYAEKSVFSFRGEWSGKLHDTVNGCSLPSKRKKSERNSFGVDTNQMCFHECENSEERQQSENKRKSIPVAQKSASDGNDITTNNISCDERNDVYVKPISGNKEKITDESPLNTTTEQLSSVVESPNMKDQQQDLAYSVLKNRMDPVLDPQSPTFEIKSPIQSSSLGSPPKSNQGNNNDQSPAERIYSTRGYPKLQEFVAFKVNSDDSGELKDSPIMKSRLSLEEDVENRMSNSSSDEVDSESSEENSQIKGCRESELLSPEIGSAKRKEFVSRQSEWLCNQEGVELTGLSPASESFKGIEESSKLLAYLEQNREDGFVSAIALIAMALDRVKTKMKSATSKKAAEILRSAAEGIHLQLQSAESQIKTDLGKLTSLSKSKRKSLETRFEEQQEQLHDIYKRFKEEIDQHLVDYKSLNQDLEEHKIELKGTMEKQRTVHNRLLLQRQQAIDIQFNDAQRRITAVHDWAKEKMLQLKLVIAEFVKEGAFS
ncbi:hypothetical protein Adt_16032 [Abeliophyllum distichum]|uniref:Meiosis-specific protein ASY3-like coiled-coil domain-containing protein n=1 Tax=Abeliophyllum distichum TaxID=126358 RepID=A0ABD1TCH6_9LAMI